MMSHHYAYNEHNAKGENKGDGSDISNMLRTFKSFDDASLKGECVFIDTSRHSTLIGSVKLHDIFRIIGLSGQHRYTVDQDASLSSVILDA